MSGSPINAAFLDASFGISGDRVLGALVAAGVPVEVLGKALRAVHPGLRLSASRASRDGVSGVLVRVQAPAAPSGALLRRLDRAGLPPEVHQKARAILQAFGKAPVSWETLAEAVGAAAGFCHLGVKTVHAGPVLLASGGEGSCAPSVLECLRGFEARFVASAFETTTPAGAAILSVVAVPGPAAPIRIASVGYGAGMRERDGFLRLILGQSSGADSDWVWEIRADLDDCSPQVLGFVGERLLQAGARDVALIPTQMKKGRPGVRLEVLASGERLAALEDLILTETPTLGVRRSLVERRVLRREFRKLKTRFGILHVKRALDPRGKWKSMPEYEDCREAAERTGTPLREVMAEVLRVAGRKP